MIKIKESKIVPILLMFLIVLLIMIVFILLAILLNNMTLNYKEIFPRYFIKMIGTIIVMKII